MTYMFILKCALKLVEEIILYYDARSKKHQNVFLISLLLIQILDIYKKLYSLISYKEVKFCTC